MTQRQKIRLLFSLTFLAGLVILIIGAIRTDNMVCTGVRVRLQDSNNYLVDSNYVKHKIVKMLGRSPKGMKIKDLNLQKIEDDLYRLPYIKHAEVYTDRHGIMYVDIWQTKPIVKVITNDRTFYIDHSGDIYLAQRGRPYYALVASGNIDASGSLLGDGLDSNKTLKDIYTLAQYINSDKFWKTNIVQIYVNSEGEYELIPRVGDFRIILGTLEDFEKKFRNLRAFYDNLSKLGWDKYSVINLSYKNQIVAVKKTI